MPPDFQTEPAGSPDETPDRQPRPDGPLIYLAAPFSDPEPEIIQRRLKQVNKYAVHLRSRGVLAFSPLSHGAPLESPDIPNHVWYELGLRIMEGCDELYLLELEGWEDSEGVPLELKRAWELDIPVYVADPDTYKIRPWEAAST